MSKNLRGIAITTKEEYDHYQSIDQTAAHQP
jgi:hypothetical protein